MAKSPRPVKKPVLTSTLRIIGGKHRGRKLSIPSLEGLRPTGDRTRETLFNWLQFDLPGLRVLDAFAGTGALGLEALSRDAESAVFVEPQGAAARNIQQSLATLGETNAQVVSTSALQYLQQCPQPFELVFVDPPFSLDLWSATLELLRGDTCLQPGGWVYLECPKHQHIEIPAEFATIKDKTSGQVRFRLLQKAD